MNQKGFINTVLIILVIVLAGVLGYITLFKRTTLMEKVSNSQNTQQTTLPTLEAVPYVSSGKYTISLETMPISFELPKGYAVFQREGFEGLYATRLSVGKEVRNGYLKYAPLGIEFLPTAYDAAHEREFSPKEYIDVVFKDQGVDAAANPQYIQLFGNKAVLYKDSVDSSITIVGYLRVDQVKQLAHEYLVRISSNTYDSGVGDDKALFDTVVNTLQIGK